MWERLVGGEIDLISTDHAPSTLEQKYGSDIWDCPFGLPGVKTTLTMFLDAVNNGKLTLEKLVEVYSTTPARMLGRYPRKGALRAGSDADFVLVDMDTEHVLRNEDVISEAGWTPFDQHRVKGRPVMTILRGMVIAENGEVTAEPGTGSFFTR